MKPEFITYMQELGLSPVLQERVTVVFNEYSSFLPEGEIIKDMAICDLVNAQQGREFTSIVFFTENFLGECKRFISEEDYDFTPYKQKIKYLSINKKDFDFINTSPTSRINIHISFIDMISANMIATQENCKNIYALYKKYLAPNVIK